MPIGNGAFRHGTFKGHMKSNLTNRTVKNVSYNAVGWVISFCIQAIANIVMTRTLLASDYGIAGMAVIFMNFFGQFSDLGITTAVVQKKELSERDLYTAFLLRAFFGTSVFLLCVVSMPIANLVFGNKDVGLLIVIFAISYLINIFGFIPVALMRKELSYGKLFFPQVAYTATGALVGIILALNGFGYWSLVYALISSTLVHVVMTNIMRPVRIKLQFDRQMAGTFLRFGANVSFTGIISFALLNADNFIVGALKGAGTLGFYIIAFNWGSMICTIIAGVVSNVLLPTFSRIQDDKERLKNAYLKIIEFIAPLAIGGNLVLFLASRDFLYLVLGHGSDKWLPSLVALQILCVYGVLRSLLEPATNVFLSINQPGIVLRTSVIAAVVELGLLYPAIKFGSIEWVAVVVTFASASQYLIHLPKLRKHLDVSLTEFFAKLLPGLVAFVVTLTLLLWGHSYLGETSWLTLGVKVFTSFGLYLLAHGMLTRWQVLREIRSMLAGANVTSSK